MTTPGTLTFHPIDDSPVRSLGQSERLLKDWLKHKVPGPELAAMVALDDAGDQLERCFGDKVLNPIYLEYGSDVLDLLAEVALQYVDWYAIAERLGWQDPEDDEAAS